MKPKVYLETSVISYLTARPSRDVVAAACQQMTRDWWEKRRSNFALYVSELVLTEAKVGDAEMARKRLAFVAGLPELDVTAEAEWLAKQFITKGPLPAKAAADALHIAVATVHSVDYLLTWNCRHIANAQMMPKIKAVCDSAGFKCPYICTPPELMGK